MLYLNFHSDRSLKYHNSGTFVRVSFSKKKSKEKGILPQIPSWMWIVESWNLITVYCKCNQYCPDWCRVVAYFVCSNNKKKWRRMKKKEKNNEFMLFFKIISVALVFPFFCTRVTWGFNQTTTTISFIQGNTLFYFFAVPSFWWLCFSHSCILAAQETQRKKTCLYRQ